MCRRGGKGAELPSDHNYLQFILEQLSDPDVSYRAMMGEFILYCRGKIAGGIGVGGGTEEQDCTIAEYVVSVFEELTG